MRRRRPRDLRFPYVPGSIADVLPEPLTLQEKAWVVARQRLPNLGLVARPRRRPTVRLKG